MTRKFKAMGMALFAVLAMSAVAAQAAQAAEEFHASAEPAVITGENEGKEIFSVAGGAAQVSCTSAKFEGTQPTQPSGTITITPTYGSTTAPTGCVDSVSGEEAIVHTNHCAYVFHAATDVNGHAEVDIECAAFDAANPHTHTIEVTIPGLGVTLSIGAQNGLKGVHYTPIDTAGKEELTLHSTVTNIATTCSGFACIFIGGEHPIGAYEGTSVVRGYEDPNSPLTGTAKTTPGSTTEGAQIDISKK